MTGIAAPIDLTSYLEWQQTGEWQYTCTLPVWVPWPFQKENGAYEWLWQMDSHLWIRVGGSHMPWGGNEADTESDSGSSEFIPLLNEDNAEWRRLEVPPWYCKVDNGPAGTHPEVAGVVMDGDDRTAFASRRAMERILWRSMQDHFRAALESDTAQDDMPIIGHDRETDWQWRRSWIDAEFRGRAGLAGRREPGIMAGPIRFTLYQGSDGRAYFTHEVQVRNTEGVGLQAVLTGEITAEGAFFRDDKLFLPVPGVASGKPVYEGISAWGVMTGALDRWERAGLYRALWSEGLEHPYTYLLRQASRFGVWRQFEEAIGADRQIPYREIARLMRHMAPEGTGLPGRPTVKNVKDYFQSRGYRTAKSTKVSVDEVMEKLVL